MHEDTGRAPRPMKHSRLGAWFDHHLASFVGSLGRSLRKPGATLLTVGVMAVALALPLGLWLALGNVARFAGEVQDSRGIAVFLKPEVGLDEARGVVAALRGRGDVAAVEWRTPEQGLAQLREQDGMGEAIDALQALEPGSNPLPHLLLVTPREDDLALARSLETLPEAALVRHDARWRARLEGWLGFGARLALVLAALLGIGALLVVGNTVRLDIQSRRDEIGVLQLLGASDGFIRRPFLYLGAWYGLAAGALALGLLTLAHLALQPSLGALAASYGSGFALQGVAPSQAGAVLLGATLVGWLGAGLVTGHYLRQTRPTDA